MSETQFEEPTQYLTVQLDMTFGAFGAGILTPLCLRAHESP